MLSVGSAHQKFFSDDDGVAFKLTGKTTNKNFMKFKRFECIKKFIRIAFRYGFVWLEFFCFFRKEEH